MVGGNIARCAGAEYCNCCRCKHFVGVRKLVELKKGLTIYHAPREVEKEDETKFIQHQVSRSLPKLGDSPADSRVIDTNPEHVEKMQADDKMVFIIHNTNYADISPEEFLPEFDINSVNCPRCQYIMIRAKTLLKSLPMVEKNMIRCVCDLCTLQQQSRVPCHFCQSIVKQFLATEIRDDRIKEYFKSFLTNVIRNLSIDSKIGKYKEKIPCSDTVTEGINKIGDLIEIQKSNLREKDIDSISKKLKKVKKVIIKTPETVIPTEDLIVDGNKDTDGKLSTIKLHPVIKPSSDTGLHKEVVRSIEQIPCKTFSDTVLGIGTTGLKQLSSSELSLSLAIKKAALKEPMKFFFPREFKEKKMKLDETSYFDLIKDTKKRLKAEADEKLIKQASKGKESTITDKTQLSKSEKKYDETREITGDEFKENDKNTTNIERKEGSKGSKSIKSGRSKDTPLPPFSGRKSEVKTRKMEENLAKIGEKNIKKDYQKKGTESKIKEGDIKVKGEKERKKSKGKSKGQESTIVEKTKLSKSEKKYDETREKKGEGSRGSKSIKSGKRKVTPLPPSSGVKSEAKTRKTEKNLAKIGEKNITKDYQKKGIEKIKEGGIKVKNKSEITDDRRVLGVKGELQEKEGLTKDKKNKKIKDKIMEKSQTKKDGIASKKNDKIKESGIKVKNKSEITNDRRVLGLKGELQEKEGLTKNKKNINKKDKIMEKSQTKMDGVAKKEDDKQVQTVEEEGDQIEESSKISLVKDKTLKTTAIKVPSPRGQKLPTVKKKQGLSLGKGLPKIENRPEEDNINEELKLLHEVIEKHEDVKTKGLKLKEHHKKRTIKHKILADTRSKLINQDSTIYIDIKGKRHKYVQSEKPEPESEPEKKGIVLKLRDIQIEATGDDLILKLIQQRHQRTHLRELAKVEIPVRGRRIHKFKTQNLSSDDDDSEKTDNLIGTESDTNIIFGSTIINKQQLPPPPEPQAQPILFRFVLKKDGDDGPINEQATTTEAPSSLMKDQPHKKQKPLGESTEPEDNFGVFKYALSDHTFIKNGWTVLPVEKIIRKMNVYRMRPAQPEYDWFERNKGKGPLFYDSGEMLAEVTDIGRGRWYYKNGRIALDYYNAEDLNAQQRFVIYSSGDIDARGHNYPVTVLGMFDFRGNGVVFDHKGKIRLKYNQTEGEILDRGLGPVCHWLWHSLNEPPVLQQVMIDTRLPFTDPTIYAFKESEDDLRYDDEKMAAIEFDNYVKTKKTKVTQKFTPYQINMKALKINDQFSLKVLDQKTVYLIFREGANTMRLNLGMVLDHTEVVDTTSAELGEVALDMEERPAKTASIAELQKSLLNAQKAHRLRTERVLKKRPLAPGLSVDKLALAASKPPCAPLMTTNVLTNYSKCETPIANDLYIKTRLI